MLQLIQWDREIQIKLAAKIIRPYPSAFSFVAEAGKRWRNGEERDEGGAGGREDSGYNYVI
jgi:hypothetical protein